MKFRRSPTLELVAMIDKARREGRPCWSLSTPSFPPPSFAPRPDPGWVKLTPAKGMPELREAARRALFGLWDLPGHECVVTAGAKAAIFATLRAAVEPGAAALVVTPAWPSYFDLCAAATLNARAFQTHLADDFRIDLDALDHNAAASDVRAIILSNPSNPTGRILSPEELAGLVEISERRGLTLIVDQSFSGIVFDAERWARSVAPASERLVVVDSFSKSWTLQGARVAATLLPRWLVEPMVTVHQTILSAAPTPGQSMALQALQEEARPPNLTEQRDMAAGLIQAMGWRAHAQTGTFYYFPFVADIDAFRQRAAARDVLLLSGEAFGAPYGRHFRLCFGKPVEEMRMIVELLSKLSDTRP